MNGRTLRRTLWPLALLTLATACISNPTTLAKTPYIMLGNRGKAVYAKLKPEQRTPEMNILYVTDRNKTKERSNGPRYGYERSLSMVYGEAMVEPNPKITWEDLVTLSTTAWRDEDYKLKVTSTRELGQVGAIGQRLAIVDGRAILPSEGRQEIETEIAALRNTIAERLKKTDQRDVYLLVHGVDNSFDDAMIRMAQLWHFMGRGGVPIAYTWPAGRGGLFGYFRDRESGEFTIQHLKFLLQALASIPELQNLHIIAHSRGTDIVSTALRELHIECRATGRDTRQVYKLTTLVLAAPDLDGDVFAERFGAEGMFNIAQNLVLYYSSNDSALGWALWLFDSQRRLGSQDVKDFTARQKSLIAQFPTMQLIQCKVSGFSNSHSYVFDDPAVMSDLILLLRDHCGPGAECGRPLQASERGFWYLSNDYLKPP